VLNDRIADGTDVSWIWDVDTEPLVASGGTFVVSGDRLYDMALRLQYSQENLIQPSQGEGPGDGQTSRLILEENLEKAVQIALELTPAEETLHIIPTYTAMLEVRGILTGRKIL
jgi:UDP-N-acetylmuramyl tripeptide synthase